MIKNKVDFKLINTALLVFIAFLIYQTRDFCFAILAKIFQILFPFLIAFAIAYAFYPFLKWLENRKIPKGISVIIIFALVIGLFALVIGLVIPMVFNQLSSLFNTIITFIKEISQDYDLNLGPLQSTLTTTFNDIIASIGKYASNGVINTINISLSVISTAMIVISASIYFLIDMDKIRDWIGYHLRKRKNRSYYYVKVLDNEMNQYLNGFMKIVVISFFEYTLAFLIINHPNALLLGFLAAVASLIPYFGGIFTNIIAAITAFVISPTLFIKTIIAFFVLSAFDGYLINPAVYGKTNNIHPLIVIISVFAGGILFGIIGIIISLPVAILLLATYRFFEEDITEVLIDKKK